MAVHLKGAIGVSRLVTADDGQVIGQFMFRDGCLHVEHDAPVTLCCLMCKKSAGRALFGNHNNLLRVMAMGTAYILALVVEREGDKVHQHLALVHVSREQLASGPAVLIHALLHLTGNQIGVGNGLGAIFAHKLQVIVVAFGLERNNTVGTVIFGMEDKLFLQQNFHLGILLFASNIVLFSYPYHTPCTGTGEESFAHPRAKNIPDFCLSAFQRMKKERSRKLAPLLHCICVIPTLFLSGWYRYRYQPKPNRSGT